MERTGHVTTQTTTPRTGPRLEPSRDREPAARREASGKRPPTTLAGRLRVVGPGLIIAATGVGAGDLVSSLAAGQEYALTFVWALVIGVVLKYFLTEGIARWCLATGTTIIEAWYSLGRLVRAYFVGYLFLLTFVFGAAVASATGLALNAMMPFLPVWAWAALAMVSGFVVNAIGRYGVFEKVMQALVGLMFVTMVGAAIAVAPGLGDIAGGLVPRVPAGSLLYCLGLMGGVGATLTLASYTYWMRDEGWREAGWIPTMRVDVKTGYIVTGIFVLSMMIVGAEFLYGTGRTIDGNEGLVPLAGSLGDRLGGITRWLFLLGFFAAAYSSLVGAWNGFAYLFADYVRTARTARGARPDDTPLDKSGPFRWLLLWITFPPMALLFFDQPVFLVIVYAALGAMFLPFLAGTLVWLLNSGRVEKPYRNGPLTNAVLGGSVLLFAILAVQQIKDAV
jgi:Mn2+/Fe2+ NRAMP family transporter